MKYYKFGGDTGLTQYRNWKEMSSCLKHEGFTNELQREHYFEIQSEQGDTIITVSSNGMNHYFITDKDDRKFNVEKLSPLAKDKESMWKISRLWILSDKSWIDEEIGEVTLSGMLGIIQI